MGLNGSIANWTDRSFPGQWVGQDVLVGDLIGQRAGVTGNGDPDTSVRWFKAAAATTGSPVASTTITAGGTGYTQGAAATFAAAPAGGVTATGTINVTGGVITSITITEPGSGYVSAPAITFSGGTGATATSTLGTSVPQLAASAVAPMDIPLGHYDAMHDVIRIRGFSTTSGLLSGLLPGEKVYLSDKIGGACQRAVPTGTGKLRQEIGEAYWEGVDPPAVGVKANCIRVNIRPATVL